MCTGGNPKIILTSFDQVSFFCFVKYTLKSLSPIFFLTVNYKLLIIYMAQNQNSYKPFRLSLTERKFRFRSGFQSDNLVLVVPYTIIIGKRMVEDPPDVSGIFEVIFIRFLIIFLVNGVRIVGVYQDFNFND